MPLAEQCLGERRAPIARHHIIPPLHGFGPFPTTLFRLCRSAVATLIADAGMFSPKRVYFVPGIRPSAVMRYGLARRAPSAALRALLMRDLVGSKFSLLYLFPTVASARSKAPVKGLMMSL